MMGAYGDPPIPVTHARLDWQEFMHYLYLPVRIPIQGPLGLGRVASPIQLPERLEFARPLVETVAYEEWHPASYIYLTAVRGFATPGNPLNRPGWHCDGFGTDDINYVWWDGVGTDFAVHPFTEIEPDDSRSMQQFQEQAVANAEYSEHWLYRLTPHVVHRAPIITEATQGMRSFLKISVSEHRYNLVGNSHNYLFDYSWPMHPRALARNDPHRAADYVEEASR